MSEEREEAVNEETIEPTEEAMTAIEQASERIVEPVDDGTAEPTPEVSEEHAEQADDFDPSWIQIGKRANLTDDQIREIAKQPNAENLFATWKKGFDAVSAEFGRLGQYKQRAAQPDPQQEPEAPAGYEDWKKKLEEHVDEELAETLAAPMKALFEQQQQQAAQHEEASMQQAWDETEGFFDSLDEYQDLFGPKDLQNRTLAQHNARTDVVKLAESIRSGAMSLGRDISWREALGAALASNTHDYDKSRNTAKIVSKAEAQAKRLTTRPTTATHSNNSMSPEEAAMAEIAQWQKSNWGDVAQPDLA